MRGSLGFLYFFFYLVRVIEFLLVGIIVAGVVISRFFSRV